MENCEILSCSNNSNSIFFVFFYLHDLVHLDPDDVGRQQQEIGRRHRRHQEGVPHLGPEEGVGDEEAGLGGQAVQPPRAAAGIAPRECRTIATIASTEKYQSKNNFPYNIPHEN